MEFQYHDSGRYVVLVFLGRIENRDISEAFEKVVKERRFNTQMARIWDFGRADMSAISVNEMVSVGHSTSNYRPDINHAKVAFVCESELQYGLSRVLAMHREESGGADADAFRSMEEAVKWVIS